MKILITGFFGKNNLGDDLMLKNFTENILDENSSNKITVLLIYDDKINFKLDPRIEVKKLPKIKKGKSLFIKYYYSILYDKLYWIGGTCFTENAGDGLYKYMKIFAKRNKKYGYVGVGIGTIKSQYKNNQIIDLIENTEFITLRDEESYKYIKNKCTNENIFLCEDLVYLSMQKEKISNEKENLVISWRELKNYIGTEKQEEAIKILIEFIKSIENEFKKIIIIPIGDEIDDEINRYIYKKLSLKIKKDRVEFVNDKNNNNRIDVIASAKLYICGRLHGIFIAECNNINTIAIGYDNKIERYLKSIEKLGDLVYPEEFEYIKLFKSYKNNEEISKKYIEDGYKKAMINIKIFNKFNKN